MPSGAELFVRSIAELGISQIFTLVGDHLNEVLAVAAREGIRILDMRHESGVTHAADAWARMQRKPAVSLVTGGPGHTNSLTGIATANLAASPLIAVSGSRATQLGERGAFQDIDQVGMARPVVKWAAEPPSAAQIPFYLVRAYSEANTGRRGAVHLTIPVDLLTAETTGAPAIPVPAEVSAPRPDSAEIDRAIALLRSAERPVIIAGSGIWWSGAEGELQEFIETASLPLYTITLAVVVGCILLALILYAFSLVSVPAIVFFPAYSIYFFASRYPGLDALVHPVPPLAPPPLPPPLPPTPEPIG